jgi:hypothetical protein
MMGRKRHALGKAKYSVTASDRVGDVISHSARSESNLVASQLIRTHGINCKNHDRDAEDPWYRFVHALYALLLAHLLALKING